MVLLASINLCTMFLLFSEYILTTFSSILFESIEFMIIYEGYLLIFGICSNVLSKLKKTVYYGFGWFE